MSVFIPQSTPGRRNAGFTLVEMLVIIGIILLLTAILAPVLSTIMAEVRRNQCADNLSQIGMAFQVLDSKGAGEINEDTAVTPIENTWVGKILPQLENRWELFQCPEFGTPTEAPNSTAMIEKAYVHYAISVSGGKVTKYGDGDSHKILLIDWVPDAGTLPKVDLDNLANWPNLPDQITRVTRHGRRTNVLLKNGVVKTYELHSVDMSAADLSAIFSLSPKKYAVDPRWNKIYYQSWRPSRDRPRIFFKSTILAVKEDAGTCEVEVIIRHPGKTSVLSTGQQIDVQVSDTGNGSAAGGGTDFTFDPQPQVLSFDDTTTDGTIKKAIVEIEDHDGILQGDKTVVLELKNLADPTGLFTLTSTTCTLTIEDVD